MINGKKIIIVNHKISLYASHQPSYEATITKVEENLFWINLPHQNKQPLILTIKQNIKIGVAIQLGYFTSETTVETIDNNINKFYGLLIPDNFTKSGERKYRRSHFSNNVIFKTDYFMALTTMIDFSAGGIQVYVTPELERILQSKDKIIVYLQISGDSLHAEVRLAWQKEYSNLPVAGFEFINADHLPRAKMANWAVKYTT